MTSGHYGSPTRDRDVDRDPPRSLATLATTGVASHGQAMAEAAALAEDCEGLRLPSGMLFDIELDLSATLGSGSQVGASAHSH